MKKSFLLPLFYALLFLTHCGNAQIITTVAGLDGVGGGCGNEGLATTHTLNFASDVKFDKAGNLFIADGCVYSIVQKLDPIGNITNFAGNCMDSTFGDGGPATDAGIMRASGLAFDDSGNLYISSMYGSVIRKVNTSGIISTIAGIDTNGFSGDGGPATAAEINTPVGLAFDVLGNLYFSDGYNARIRKIDVSGIISTVVGNGIVGFSGDGGPATAAEIGSAEAVIFDKNGNLYFADVAFDRIREVSTNGIITTIAGNGIGSYSGDGGPATDAEFDQPLGLAIDKMGDLFISDDYNNVVREVNATSGIITTIAGNFSYGYGFSGDGGAATAAELFGPTMMTFDSVGNLYIAEWYNYDIRKVTGLPTIITDNHEIANENNIFSYPNPANTQLNISLKGVKGKTLIVIYNMLGQQMLNQTTDNEELITLSTVSIPEGIYMLHIQTDDGNTINRKFEIVR